MWSGEKVDVSEEVKEDWQLSQFWYSKQSAESMAKMALNAIKVVLIGTLFNYEFFMQ